MPSKNKDYSIPQDLLMTIKDLYGLCQFVCSEFIPEKV